MYGISTPTRRTTVREGVISQDHWDLNKAPSHGVERFKGDEGGEFVRHEPLGRPMIKIPIWCTCKFRLEKITLDIREAAASLQNGGWIEGPSNSSVP